MSVRVLNNIIIHELQNRVRCLESFYWLSSCSKALLNATPFMHCVQTDRRRKSSIDSRVSHVPSVMHRPNSCKNSCPLSLIGQSDSIATGTNSCMLGRDEYFKRLRSVVCSAAPLVTVDDRYRYDDVHVWMAVASHAKNLPLDHGTKVTPTGLLPFLLVWFIWLLC